ncbi:MAG: 4-hydroxy-3-methylbut-2-enyl diphosphate reductase [Treponema sp.]|jgi:4-hydroxy-3-methylbut-2-enyl diphosphate reductase|nr:4-hydroxy-3-methylbut-2-enyl diphosphate reductase [Treponema sp.]
MRVIRARVLGFCMGVRRAVDIAFREAAQAEGPVYTIGPLIHNPQALASLKERGVKILQEEIPQNLSGAVIIIRAHGIPPCLEEKLRERGGRIVDATCPKVKTNQLKARALSEQGHRVFLAGERDHGEIVGIRGYASRCILVAGREDAGMAAERLFRDEPDSKTALLGQTTLSISEYESIGEAIRTFFPRLEIIHTICGATKDRQEALKELLGMVETVVIAGGRESANTRRLLAIAEGLGKKAWLVESAAGIPREVRSYRAVGLSAGASTPDQTIDEIEKTLCL